MVTFAESLLPAIAAVAISGLGATAFLCWRQWRLARATRRQALDEAARLRVSEQRFRKLADAAFEGIVIHRSGIILDANATLARMLGYRPEDLPGRRLHDLTDPDRHEHLDSHLRTLRDVGGDRQRRDEAPARITETLLRHADGSAISADIYAGPLPFDDGDARVVIVRDTRERKAAEEQIRHLAHHDGLTGLPNRALFRDRLAQAIARAKRAGTTVAVLSLDLDGFRSVNETGGTETGDSLLREVALRLGDSIRADDTVARIAGDEFAIIQVGVSHPDGPAVLAGRLVKGMAQPFHLPGRAEPISIGASVGIALFPEDGDCGDALTRAADHARVRAENSGRGTYRFFEPEMDRRLVERRALEADLRQALAAGQLELNYQPLADCRHVTLRGFEALVRWRHPQRGPVSPAEFIPLAEECGLISQLGAWVLRTSTREAATWPSHISLAVNLSPVQFRQPELAAEILGILAETGLDPARLELEITEGVLIVEPERTLGILNTLKAAGVRISLDDFGTGYSSLAYLQRFPFDKLKIDRSFIQGMEGHGGSMAIVRAVIALGRSLQLTVTAEGVETQQQLALLQAQSCDEAQGYLLGKPLPIENARRLIGDRQPLLPRRQAAE